LVDGLPAVAENVADLEPAGTVTEPGTVSALLFEESATVAFPLGAGAERVTVQVDLAPAASVVGEHCSLTVADRTVTVPPVPPTVVALPFGRAPRSLVRERGTEVPALAVPKFTVAVATVPLPMALAFMPVPTHVTAPLAVLQAIVFPTAVRAGPAAMLIEAMVPVG
jgi:hypothetical protein